MNVCVCVMYASFGCKVKQRTVGYITRLFNLRFRLLVYSAESGVNRVQIVLSGFNMRLLCFVQAFFKCRYV